MKIAVITMHAVKNYGSVLQTYATQCVLEKMGLTVEIINFIREKILDKNLASTWTRDDKFIKKIMKKIILYPTIYRWKKVFNNYLLSYIKLSSRIYTSEEELIEYPVNADVFCTGSDQVWNSGWNEGVEKPFYLTFVPDDIPKISLAASIGKQYLEEEEITEILPLLKRYKHISLRELSAIKIINDLGIKNVDFCLDPTLLLSKEEWLQHLHTFDIKEKYVLIYQLNHDTKFDDFAVRFAKRKNLKLIRICTRYDQVRFPGKAIVIPKVEELLNWFDKAEYIITNSFHATAFCINLNKQFVAIYPNEYSTRIKDVLEMFNLENRHLKDYKQYDIADEKINYQLVNEKLKLKRKESFEVIRKMLCNSK